MSWTLTALCCTGKGVDRLKLSTVIPVCLTSHVDEVCVSVCLNSCWADTGQTD